MKKFSLNGNSQKTISIILCLILVITCTPLVSLTASAAVSGSCGANVKWSYDTATKTLTISGTGAMNEYAYSKRPWKSYESTTETLIVEDGVTSLCVSAFCSFIKLTKVQLGNTLTEVESDAFSRCIRLPEITIPDSVTTISDYAFSECLSLKTIHIPKNVATLGDRVFEYCESLEKITADEDSPYFSNDENGVLFNKDKTELVFYPPANSLTSYTIPDGVTTINDYAFLLCINLINISLPRTLTTIERCAFAMCTALTELKIPYSVTFIGDCNFEGCSSMESITFPGRVPSVDKFTFYDCTSLELIHFLGTEEQYNNLAASASDNNEPFLEATKHFCEERAAIPPTCENGIEVGWYCPVCDEYIEGGNIIAGSHCGGNPTCITPATCEVCNEEYNNPNNHEQTLNENGVYPCCDKYEAAMLNSSGIYEISNAGQLMWFSENINNKSLALNTNAVLTKDIDLQGILWIPIAQTNIVCSLSTGYEGTFNGNGYTIKNISISESSDRVTTGLFGTVSENGKIIMMAIENFTYNSDNYTGYTGGIAGHLMPGAVIENCYVINSTIKAPGDIVGGIAGLNMGNIVNCYSMNLNITSLPNLCGGICGDWATSESTICGEVNNCYTDHTFIGGTNNAGITGTTQNSSAAVTTETFSKGEIACRLQKGNTTQVWGQDNNQKGACPILTSKELYKVIPIGETGNYSIANTGDINSDETIDATDYQILINTVLEDNHQQIKTAYYDDIIKYDLDGDGSLDILDAHLMDSVINGHKVVEIYGIGDFDCNGKAFEKDDILEITTGISAPENLTTHQKYRSDINGDGKFSYEDINMLTSNRSLYYNF